MKRIGWLVAFFLFMAINLMQSAEAKNRRLFKNKKPGHSNSVLMECGNCHLTQYPELRPKLKAVDDPLYQNECNSCHLAYQPGLLPASSWIKVMDGLGNHFGEEIFLTKSQVKSLKNYTKNYAADRSQAIRSKKVIMSLQGAIPIQVMEVPYIKEFHNKIEKDVISRKKIRSLANCEACHISASAGLYFDKHIFIPD
ncbi:MAG: cytochrome C [Proteobacteria bacterium]|nr:cytochrome C [Pseudomonadota bacterium]